MLIKNRKLHYAGALKPDKVWKMLSTDVKSVLIDVRTEAETLFAGEPNLTGIGKSICGIEWAFYPSYRINSAFISQLRSLVPDMTTVLFFICSSGGRSISAAIAATKSGYISSYSVADGFEGRINFEGHRGQVSGWKAKKLPWTQI